MLVLNRTFLNLWLTLMTVWAIANASLDPQVLLTGVLLSALLALLFAPTARAWQGIRWSPRVIYHYLLYLGVFLVELFKANFSVARLVLTPKLEIHPGIVQIRTRLKSPLGRLALANSITLTPGTLVVDMHEDALFVHVINVRGADIEQATQEISGRFEQYLEVIFG